jgi:hypothetical protein
LQKINEVIDRPCAMANGIERVRHAKVSSAAKRAAARLSSSFKHQGNVRVRYAVFLYEDHADSEELVTAVLASVFCAKILSAGLDVRQLGGAIPP